MPHVRAEALEQARSQYPDIGTYLDLDAALRAVDADAVIINTPSHLHFDQVSAALDAGKHVLVAKPVTNDFEQAVRLVELAGERNVTLSVGQQMRYMRHYQAVRRAIANGELGSVEALTLLNAKPRPNVGNLAGMSQPALYEMSCHHFDSLAAVLDDRRPISISCDGFNPSWSAYDGPSMVNALIRYEGDLHVLYQAGFSSQAPNYELRVEGSGGALRCRGVHMSVDAMTNEFAAAGADFRPSDVDRGIDIVNPWSVHLDLWYRYVNGDAEPPFSGRRNLPVVALLSAGIESVEQGGAPVRVTGNPRFDAAFAVPVTKASR